MDIEKYDYLENKKSFLDEIKSIFHILRRAIIWWKNKNLIKIVDTSFKDLKIIYALTIVQNFVIGIWPSLMFAISTCFPGKWFCLMGIFYTFCWSSLLSLLPSLTSGNFFLFSGEIFASDNIQQYQMLTLLKRTLSHTSDYGAYGSPASMH